MYHHADYAADRENESDATRSGIDQICGLRYDGLGWRRRGGACSNYRGGWGHSDRYLCLASRWGYRLASTGQGDCRRDNKRTVSLEYVTHGRLRGRWNSYSVTEVKVDCLDLGTIVGL